MHVLIIPSWYPLNDYDLNGCFFREQALAIAREGVKVGVVAPQFRSLRGGRQAIFNRFDRENWRDQDVCVYLEHNVFWFPKIPYLDLLRWTNVALKLFTQYIEDNGKPDLIHVQSALLAGPAALKIFKKFNIPYCITEHSSTFARNLIRPWQYRYLKDVQDNAKKCMAVSLDLAKLLENRLGAKWEYCPNLLDNLFVKEFDENQINKKKTLQFCAVAHLNPNKGFDILLKAFALVLEKEPDVKLVLGGDGLEKENLKKLAQTLNIEEAVTFTGALSRENVRLLMAESSCFVLSSHVETFGVVIIEALSQGTPVVATKCGGPESIIVSGDGILVEVADVNALAQAMKEVVDNPELYDSDSIRQRCLERFSEKAFISRVKEVYKHCIKSI